MEQACGFMRLAAIMRIVEEKTPAESVRKERHLYSCWAWLTFVIYRIFHVLATEAWE